MWYVIVWIKWLPKIECKCWCIFICEHDDIQMRNHLETFIYSAKCPRCKCIVDTDWNRYDDELNEIK